ncbi:MAG: hypothetical protein IPH07_36935 [Deltaproteobacteria bacterium]|nr:hypothetical protein [Deltaproteobacteria bacterium]MBK8713410.1 hypothetical protein [Deltaproteobacteria bacterium]MBP7288035.1 hypothetical protein [Nannocystaceae bacterium]
MDDELSERARKLVELAMAQDLPPVSVVEDSWGMVVSRVTADTERAPASVADPRPARRGALRIGFAVAVVAAIAVVAGLALRPPPVVAPVPAPVRATPPPLDVAETTAPKPSTAGMLDDAEAAVAISPARALELVDRHAELAPTSEPERRMVLRIEVLCALDRAEEARAEATAFLAESRAEPWRARVRASCAGAAP